MSKRYTTIVFAGSALLMFGAAIAQQQNESRSQKPSSQEQSTTAPSDTRNNSGSAYADDQRDTDRKTERSQETETAKSTRLAARGNAAAPVMMMLLVPVALEKKTDNTLANGCWAKLYDDYNYGGDSFTLVGPMDLPRMIGPFGVDWDDKISSIKTGPKATVTIYDNEMFRDRAAQIQPGKEVAQITEKMGLLEEFNSMKINCAGTSTASN